MGTGIGFDPRRHLNHPPVDLAALVYELLDAHADTAELAAELVCNGDTRWSSHLDYLKALQRCGRAALATAEDGE
jgi:hypothetical protein